MKKYPKETSPFKRMQDWDESWKGGEYPSWLPKLAKAYLNTRPDMRPMRMTNDMAVTSIFYAPEFHGLFDHWGRRGIKSQQTLVTMPYGNYREKAEVFACKMGLLLISQKDEAGAWFPSTFLFEFANPVAIK